MADKTQIIDGKIFLEEDTVTAKTVIVNGRMYSIPTTGAAGEFVPYPNPRYGMAGGHQNMTGGMQ